MPSIKGLVVKEFVRGYEATRRREATLHAYRSLPEEPRGDEVARTMRKALSQVGG